MNFEETYLNDNILDALYDMHFEKMTPVQEKCIPPILDGYDVIGVAQTGTGKTAAYLLPILSLLDDGDFPKDAVNCIVMAPTRELAQQIGYRQCRALDIILMAYPAWLFMAEMTALVSIRK